MADNDGNGLAKCRHGIAMNEVCSVCNAILDDIAGDGDNGDDNG